MTSNVKPFLRPAPEQVVVEIVQQDRPLAAMDGIAFDLRQSKGGVALPDSVEMEPDEAIVIMVGDGTLEPEVSEDFIGRVVDELTKPPSYWSLDDRPNLGPRYAQYVRDTMRQVARNRRPPRVKVGDRVLIQPWACTSVLLDGHDYMICKESDILGIFQ